MVRTREEITQLIKQNQETISGYGAKHLGLFGSFVRNEVDAESDIDLIVEFIPGSKTYDNFINLAYFLEDLFGRRVELVTPSSLSRYLKPHIEKSIQYVSLT